MSYSTTGSVATLWSPTSYTSVSKMPVPSTTRRYGISSNMYHTSSSTSDRSYYPSSGTYTGRSSLMLEHRSRFSTPTIRSTSSTSSYTRSISDTSSDTTSKLLNRDRSESRDNSYGRINNNDIISSLECKYGVKSDTYKSRPDRYLTTTSKPPVRNYILENTNKYSSSSAISSRPPKSLTSSIKYDTDKKLSTYKKDKEDRDDNSSPSPIHCLERKSSSLLSYSPLKDLTRDNEVCARSQSNNYTNGNLGKNTSDHYKQKLARQGSLGENSIHKLAREKGFGRQNSFTELTSSVANQGGYHSIKTNDRRTGMGSREDSVDLSDSSVIVDVEGVEEKSMSVAEIRKKFDKVDEGSSGRGNRQNYNKKQVSQVSDDNNSHDTQKNTNISSGVILGVHNFGQVQYLEKKSVKKMNDEMDTMVDEDNANNRSFIVLTITEGATKCTKVNKTNDVKLPSILTPATNNENDMDGASSESKPDTSSQNKVDKKEDNASKTSEIKSAATLGTDKIITANTALGYKAKRSRSPKDDKEVTNAKEKLKCKESETKDKIIKISQVEDKVEEENNCQDDNSSSSHTSGVWASDGTAGARGLKNLGNTCFMNAVIQCLANTKPLLQYIERQDYVSDTKFRASRIMRRFADVVNMLWNRHNNNNNSPGDDQQFKLREELHKFAPCFAGTDQHDAQEFLRYILLGLHEDVNRVKSKPETVLPDIDDNLSDNQKAIESWKRYLRLDNSAISDIFVGQLKSTLKFTECGHQSVTHDPFWDLSLPIPTRGSGSVQLKACLDALTKEEVLDGDERPKCAQCNVRQKCYKSFSIQRFPQVLVLHLKRFSPPTVKRDRAVRSKLSTLVVSPTDTLMLSQYAANPSDECTYNLYAVINHCGSLTSGHYTAVCKHAVNGKWYDYNDRLVRTSTRSTVTSEAYVLFYELTNARSSLS